MLSRHNGCLTSLPLEKVNDPLMAVGRAARFTLIELLVVLPACRADWRSCFPLSGVSEAALRSQCVNNLKADSALALPTTTHSRLVPAGESRTWPPPGAGSMLGRVDAQGQLLGRREAGSALHAINFYCRAAGTIRTARPTAPSPPVIMSFVCPSDPQCFSRSAQRRESPRKLAASLVVTDRHRRLEPYFSRAVGDTSGMFAFYSPWPPRLHRCEKLQTAVATPMPIGWNTSGGERAGDL